MANDPQDVNSPHDTENIYYEVTDTSLNFKYEFYEPWNQADGSPIGLLYIDWDNSADTGGEITFFDNYGSENIEGIDAMIYEVNGFYGVDGVYAWTEGYYGDEGGFVLVDEILWSEREANTDIFYFGVSKEIFEGLS